MPIPGPRIGYVCESHLADWNQLVAKQAIAWPMVFWRGELGLIGRLGLIKHRALKQVDIEIPVAVIVEQRHSRTHDFGQKVLAG